MSASKLPGLSVLSTSYPPPAPVTVAATIEPFSDKISGAPSAPVFLTIASVSSVGRTAASSPASSVISAPPGAVEILNEVLAVASSST